MTFDLERMLRDMEEQRRCYERMAEVTREQNRCIVASEMDALMGILQRKNALLEELNVIDRRSAPDRNEWNQRRSAQDADTVRRVEASVAETKSVLSKLIALEDEGRTMMERQKGSTADRMQELQRLRKVRQAYGTGGPGESRFYDKNQ